MSLDVENLYDRRADARWERVSVSDLVERLVWSTPDKPALIGWEGAYSDDRFRSLTYRELDGLANRIGQGLVAGGLNRGDVAVMMCENSVEAYAFKLGAAKAGVVVAPFNPAMAPDVVSHLIGVVEPKFAVVDAELWPNIEKAFRASDLTVDLTIEIGGDAVAGSQGFAAFVDAYPAIEPDVVIHGDDIWEILFTSGTSAMPKGVMISHTSSTLAAYGFALSLTRGLRFESDLVVGTFLPMVYHIGHNIFALAGFATGGSMVIGRRPDAAAVADAIRAHHITGLWAGSPAMLGALLTATNTNESDISSLTVMVYGWAPVPAHVLDGLRAQAPKVTAFGIFGQTESISCHRFWPDKWDALYRETTPRINYVGIPSPLLSSQVVDAEGVGLEGRPGEPGEAVYRSPVMTAGYYKDSESTRVAFRDGWFHSGDSCVYDENGLRIMVDRFKDIVKTGGENVSSIRVESVLMLHPSVQKAAVIGVPDDRWGEAVTAIVVPAEKGQVTEVDLIEFARERLAGYETPKSIVFVDSVPETVGGKIMKFKLREQYR